MFFKLPSFAWYGVLSGICGNISAGYFAALIIVPNFSPLRTAPDVLVLIYYVVFAIVFLVLAVWLDARIKRRK